MNKKINTVLTYVTIASIIGVLLVPLVKMDSMFFPFITGKAFAFRALVGIGFFSYLCLAFRDRTYLPKKNALLLAVAIFTGVLGVATILAENPFRSFWSNFERMEGYVTILYLFAFFVITSTVIRTKKMWHMLLAASLCISIAVGLSGFADYSNAAEGTTVRIAGLLGNSTYLGIYSLLHALIAVFLASKATKQYTISQRPGVFLALIAVAIFNLVVLYNTGTRGAVVGLGAGILVAALLIALFEKQSKLLKKSAIGILIAAVVVITLLGVTKNTEFVKNNQLLYRFASLITTDISSVIENQGKSRSLLWGIAKEGIAERPVLGWGQENFSYVFGKHYNPKIYDQEQWFDRTHNVFMDWLIAGGALGLLSYLSLFAAALFIIWKRKVGEDWDIFEKSLLTGLLVAYFVHNIFVFDNLTSYIVFFLLLAYISKKEEVVVEVKNEVSDTATYLVIAVSVLLFGFVSYYTVYKPYMASKTLIYGLVSFQPGAENVLGKKATTYEGRLSYFKDALAYNTFAQPEIVERLAEVTPQVIAGIKEKNIVEEYVAVVDANFKEVIERGGNDHRAPLLYGVFLQKVGLFDLSLEYISKAETLAPLKQSVKYQKGLTYLMMGRAVDAVKVYSETLALAPENKEGKLYLAVALMYDNRLSEAKEILNNDISLLSDPRVLQTADSLKLYNFIVEVAEKKVASEPRNPQYHVSLAAAYLKANKTQAAIAEIRKAIEIEPAFKEQGEFYITEIQAGRNPAE